MPTGLTWRPRCRQIRHWWNGKASTPTQRSALYWFLHAIFEVAMDDEPMLGVEIVEYVMVLRRGENPILPKSARDYRKVQAQRSRG